MLKIWLSLCLALGWQSFSYAAQPWKTGPEESSTLKWASLTTGFCPALFALLAREGQPVNSLQEFIPQARLEYWTTTGEMDLLCGFARTDEREEKFKFIDVPLFHQDYVLIARKSDPASPKNWDDVRALGKDGVLLFNRDSPSAAYIKGLGGLTFDATGSNIQTNLRKLTANRARFVFHVHAPSLKVIKEMQLENEVRILQPPLRKLPFYLAVNKDAAPERIKALTAALQRLQSSGELQKLEAEWFQVKP